MSVRRVWYMHTMHGHPAYFDADTQRVYVATQTRPAVLVPTLRRLRGQQQRSLRSWRGGGLSDQFSNYGYVRVVLPVVKR